MVREHDEHLLPHDPALGKEGRQVTGSSEGLSCSEASTGGQRREVSGCVRGAAGQGPMGLLLLTSASLM